MTGSSDNRITAAARALALVVLAAALLVPARVAAQNTDGPVLLFPEQPIAPADDPAAAPDGDTRVPESISVNRLDAPTIGSIGVLGPLDSGIPPSAWDDSDPAIVNRLLALLPTQVRSPAVHDLLLRLLATAARAPGGDQTDSEFLERRLAALVALGAFETVEEMISMLPPNRVAGRIRAHGAAVQLLGGGRADACRTAQAEAANDDDRFWQQTLILCQAVDGQAAAARLGLDLLRDQGTAAEADFVAVVSALIGDRSGLPDTIRPTPVNVAGVLATGAKVPDQLIADAGPDALQAIVDQTELPIDIRLAAGEAAAASGALTPERLGELYAELPFSPGELAEPVDAALELDGASGRALLFQASRQQQTPLVRADHLRALLDHAAGLPGVGPVARADAPALRSLVPTPALMDFSATAVRAALLLDQPDSATAWLAMLTAAERLDPAAGRLLARLVPLAALGGGDFGRTWSPALAGNWRAALPDDMPDDARAALSGKMFILLDAYGFAVGNGWSELLDDPLSGTVEVPSVGVRYGMREAARHGRLGETVLFAAIALGEAGPARASALALGAVVRSLRAVGLDDDARAIAIEALIESGA